MVLTKTENFIKECKEKFGENTFDYSKVIYKHGNEKVCIICHKHGEFWTTPNNFKNSVYGCSKCSKSSNIKFEKFLKKAKLKFGDKFDYSKVNYINKNNRITIICPIHGDFEITPEKHLNSPTGCQKCSKEKNRKKLVDGKDRKQMKEYRIWKAIKTRTTNLKNKTGFHYIVNKGIKCCDEWLNSFEQFYKDMGPCPKNYSIDRIDNSGDYCPENCRWASSHTQAENRGEFNLLFEYKGHTYILKKWAKILNINYSTLYSRIYKHGLSFENAIKKDPFNKLYEFNGEKKKLTEWCKLYNISYKTVLNRICKYKWSIEEALLIPYKQKRSKFKI